MIRWQLWRNNRRDSLSEAFSANLIINFSISYISLNPKKKILSFQRINYIFQEEEKLSSKKNLESIELIELIEALVYRAVWKVKGRIL